MKCKLLLTAGFITSAFAVSAQSANKGYAITGNGTKDFMWMNIRQVDLGTGQITKTFLQQGVTEYSIKNVDNGMVISQAPGSVQQNPMLNYVAAAAYDRRTDKLFYTPMRIGEIRWMETGKNGEPSFFATAIPGYVASPMTEEANNITRMVIGADNFGYAVSNDGEHFYRFTTGKKPSITDLGPLVDAEENAGLSVHNKCSSWGGDMIADAYGKLYIISATRSVFVVDPATRITSYKGSITGIPANYTTNGAAVDADGNVVICSATAFEGYYKMSIKDLVAKKIEGSDIVYNASDLASGNLLMQKEADAAKEFTPLAVQTPASLNGNLVYPNPVTGNSFNLLLDKKMNGNYTVVLTDLAGRAVQSEKAGFSKGQQSYQVDLRSRPKTGTYFVKVYDENKNVVLSDKVLIL